uniref:C-type lectin domain-containing protein n=1 Tax=Panagrolaimus sp. ES5 TaxID=591445 RepID=A0AC34FQU9_9BILA
MMSNDTSLKSGFKIKIVNEDDHSIQFQIGLLKRWLDPKGEWEVEIDPSEESMKYCRAWFNGIQLKANKFMIMEEKNVKYMIRKDDGIYRANFDGTNEVCQNTFDVESLLSHRMAQMKFVGVYKVKIVNEDDHPILFEIDGNKKWIEPTEEFEVTINSKSKGICAAWFNEAHQEPMEFSIWAEKDTKFMVRKDDGIYKADFDGTNEICHVKLKVESYLEQRIGKLKCLSACKILTDGIVHTLSSKDAFDMDIEGNLIDYETTGEVMEESIEENDISTEMTDSGKEPADENDQTLSVNNTKRQQALYLIGKAFISAKCPEEAVVSSLDNSTCYLFVSEYKSFIVAEEYCNLHDGNLASIHDMFESDFINSYIRNNFLSYTWRSYWIGLTDLKTPASYDRTGPWYWTDGTSMKFKDWDSYQPKASLYYDCGSVQVAAWSTGYCNILQPFVCKVKMLASTATTVSLSTTPKIKTCQENWLFYNTTGFCYLLVEKTMNWYDAEQDCFNYNAHLASIHSLVPFDSIDNKCYSGYLAFTGLSIGYAEWSWTDGTPFNFTAWAPNYETLGFGACVALWNGQQCSSRNKNWVQDFCDLPNPYFICKKLPE